MKTTQGLEARTAAARLLAGVLVDKRMLSEMTEGAGSVLSALAPHDRARAQTLAATVLRNLDPIDIVLAEFVPKPPPLPVRNILRIAATEILVEGIAPHGAVNASVSLTGRLRKHRHLKGLVNAVARRVADHGTAVWDNRPPARLPGWLGKRVAAAWGEAAASAIADAHLAPPPVDLTLRDPADADRLCKSLGADMLPSGSLRLRRAGQISRLPGYDGGEWWVQDAAAAMPVSLLGPVDGRSVLDLCAAPGGKTLQLAAAGAKVTAVDLSSERLARVHENLARTGLEARTVTADALTWQPGEAFDAILLDAPCSATGTLRRHPDLPHVRPDPDRAPLLDLQARLIRRSLGWLRPGGRLLYCTCSLLAAEGEDQIAVVLAEDNGLDRAPVWPGWIEGHWRTKAGDLRLRPDFWADRGGMDGFFAAVLRKRP